MVEAREDEQLQRRSGRGTAAGDADGEPGRDRDGRIARHNPARETPTAGIKYERAAEWMPAEQV